MEVVPGKHVKRKSGFECWYRRWDSFFLSVMDCGQYILVLYIVNIQKRLIERPFGCNKQVHAYIKKKKH